MALRVSTITIFHIRELRNADCLILLTDKEQCILAEKAVTLGKLMADTVPHVIFEVRTEM